MLLKNLPILHTSRHRSYSEAYHPTAPQIASRLRNARPSGNVTMAPPVAPQPAQQSTLHLTPVPEASPPGPHSPHRTTRKSDIWQHEPQRPPPPAAQPCVPPPSAERGATSDSTWPAPTPSSPCSSPSDTGYSSSPSRGRSGCRNWSPRRAALRCHPRRRRLALRAHRKLPAALRRNHRAFPRPACTGRCCRRARHTFRYPA